VEVRRVADPDRVVSLVISPGQLSFRPVLESRLLISPLFVSDQSGDTSPLPPGVDPDTGLTVDDDPTQEAWLAEYAEDGSVLSVHHVGPSRLGGADLESVQVASTGGVGDLGQWQVLVDMSLGGAAKFQDMTREAASQPSGHPRRQIAIVLDGVVVSAAYVNDDVDPNVGIDGGSAVITTGASENQQQAAEDLAAVLRYGPLPVTFEIESVFPED
jgi:preprotein translocase subunit SecD